MKRRGKSMAWKRPELDTEKILERGPREQEHLTGGWGGGC